MTIWYPDQDDYSSIFDAAHQYAVLSADYTINYPGWSDQKERVYQRILTGRFGQEWVKVVLHKNRVPFREDTSDHTQADRIDFVVGGATLDIKTNARYGIRYQVNKALKSNPIDYYVFLELSHAQGNITNQTQVLPLGVTTKAFFWEQSVHITYQQAFPGSRITNNFRGGSNILARNQRTPMPPDLVPIGVIPFVFFIVYLESLARIETLEQANQTLLSESQQARGRSSDLQQENDVLRQHNADLWNENQALKEHVERMDKYLYQMLHQQRNQKGRRKGRQYEQHSFN